MSLESYINQAEVYIAELRATIAKRDAEIATLQMKVANRAITIARYKAAYKAERIMFEESVTLRDANLAEIAQLRAEITGLIDGHTDAIDTLEKVNFAQAMEIAQLQAQVAQLSEKLNVKCYVIVAKIYDRHGTSEEYVKAYLSERDANTHVAGMREFQPNNEEYSVIMVPLRIELIAGVELLDGDND